MTANTTINLAALPSAKVLRTLSYDQLREEMEGDLKGLAPELEPVLALPSEPLTKQIDAAAYRWTLRGAEYNDRARGLLLAHATGADLDHLAANEGVKRLVIQEADPSASPPIPEVLEDDDALRFRVQLAQEGRAAGGTSGYWRYHALTADPRVREASVQEHTPQAGSLTVTVLAADGNGTAAPELVEAVHLVLSSEEVRQLCTTVVTQGATITPYTVEATLTLLPGPGEAEVLAAAQAAVTRTVDQLHTLGRDVTRAALFAALMQEGVQNVSLISPAADLVIGKAEAGYCTAITITVGGRDE